MGLSPRRRSVRALSALACSCALLASPNSRGEPKSAEPNAVESARSLFYQALALQDQGKWAQALELLQRVAETRESAQVRFNIAFNEEHLGRLAEAARGYERAIELATQSRAENVVTASRDRLGRLAPRIARLVVWSTAEGVLVALDGEVLEQRDHGRALPVDVGDHLIDAEAPGHEPLRTSFHLAGGETRELRIELEPIRVEPPQAAATKAAPASFPVAPPPNAPVSRESSPSPLPYIAGGAAVLSVATAVVFYTLRKDALDTMRSSCEGGRCPEELRSTNEKGMLYTTVANIALATGIGLGGVSAGLFISEVGDDGERRDVGIRANVSTTF